MHGDVHGLREALGRAVHHAAVQIVARCERDGMHDDVEPAPGLGDRGEHGLFLSGMGRVHRQDQRSVELLGEGAHETLGFLVEIGDREFGSCLTHGLRHAPADGLVVRDPDDEGALACENARASLCPRLASACRRGGRRKDRPRGRCPGSRQGASPRLSSDPGSRTEPAPRPRHAPCPRLFRQQRGQRLHRLGGVHLQREELLRRLALNASCPIRN